MASGPERVPGVPGARFCIAAPRDVACYCVSKGDAFRCQRPGGVTPSEGLDRAMAWQSPLALPGEKKRCRSGPPTHRGSALPKPRGSGPPPGGMHAPAEPTADCLTEGSPAGSMLQTPPDPAHRHSNQRPPEPLHFAANVHSRLQIRGSARGEDGRDLQDGASGTVALSTAIHDGIPSPHPQGGIGSSWPDGIGWSGSLHGTLAVGG
jgi:hypothetical protein